MTPRTDYRGRSTIRTAVSVFVFLLIFETVSSCGADASGRRAVGGVPQVAVCDGDERRAFAVLALWTASWLLEMLKGVEDRHAPQF